MSHEHAAAGELLQTYEFTLLRDPLFVITQFVESANFYISYDTDVFWQVEDDCVTLVIGPSGDVKTFPLDKYFSWLRCTSILKELANERLS
jgi:hypothetical protein